MSDASKSVNVLEQLSRLGVVVRSMPSALAIRA